MAGRAKVFGLWLFVWTAWAFGIDFDKDSPWTVSLNSSWQFRTANLSEIELLNTFSSIDYDDRGWKSIPVPSNWELEGFEEPRYARPDPDLCGLYRKWITLPASWDGRQVLVHFEGVAFGYTLYVNGQEAGGFEHAFLPCQFDITGHIRKGENLIALKVYRNHPQTEFDCNDDWALSGIYRDVMLFSPPMFFMDDLILHTGIHTGRQYGEIEGQVELRFFRREDSPKDPLPTLSLSIELADPEGRPAASQSQAIAFRDAEFFPQTSFRIPVENAVFWNAEQPALYELVLTLSVNGEPSHTIRRKVGLRQVTVEGRVLKINGKPVKLRGVCRHEIHPEVGRALGEEHWRQDIEMIKAANMNAVRCSHYPPHPRFLELCDQYGLYVLDEVPIGFGETHQANPNLLGAMLSRADQTVRRDRNHPSVIIWGIGNENPLTANLEKTAEYVKRLDPDRLAYYPGGDFRGSTSTDDTGHAAFLDFYSRHYPSTEQIQRHTENTTVAVPYLYTELNHALDTAFGDFAAKWEMIQKTDHLAGAMIWLWADQGIRRTINGRPVHDSYADIENLGPSDLSGDLYIDSNTILDSHGQYGTDGIVYADRRPQTDYFQARQVYSPVVIREREVSIQPGVQTIELTAENRYDFTDLSQLQIHCGLYQNRTLLSQGVLSISCPPHGTQVFQLPVQIPDPAEGSDLRLELEFRDHSGKPAAEHNVRLIPASGKPDWMALHEQTAATTKSLREDSDGWHFPDAAGTTLQIDPGGLLALKTKDGQIWLQGPFLRAGRKPTMAERRKYRGAELEIWEPSVFRQAAVLASSKSQDGDRPVLHMKMRYQSPDETKTVQADLQYTLASQGWIDVEYTLRPEAKEGVMLELGLSFDLLLPVDQVRWLGLGPYPAYPQKSELCRRGIYTLRPQDAFFEGNRMEVDAAIFTDNKQNGLGILCRESHLAWETRNEGLTISHSALVAGLGTKFKLPRTLIEAEKIEQVKGRFRIVFPDKRGWPKPFEDLFNEPRKN
jgi:beta-galactosidase